ncbi:hypothetical protein N9Z43_05105 [Akkermansiaceae bacterium]|nr:hypothetical protein [Akkermansiaceae bacterium]
MSADSHEHHDDHHHVLPWWKKYFFSTDHKTIGIQYGLAAGAFLLFGFFPDDCDAVEHCLSS